MVQPKTLTPSNYDLYTYASNKTPTRTTFIERDKFRNSLFASYHIPNYFDFWWQDRFYGKASIYGTAIRPNVGALKQLRYTSAPNLFAINFVADAWRDFSEKLRRLVQENILFDDGPYASPLVSKAWRSAYDSYHQYMLEVIYPIFTTDFLKYTRGTPVRNVQDFITQFGYFCAENIGFGGPVTFSGFVESIFCSPLETGLVIEISDDSHGDDFNKEEGFYYDQNFPLVVKLASQYGFAIDKNAPWRFCADLSSPAMVEYMVGVPDQSQNPPRGPFNFYVGTCTEPVYTDPSIPEPYGYSAIPGLENVLRHAGRYDIYEELATGIPATQEEIADVVFRNAYAETWALDMDVLKYYLVGFYNVYVEGSPYLVEYRGDGSACSPYRNSVHVRQGVDPKQFSLEVGAFGGEWALSCYYYLRCIEKGFKKSESEKRKDLQSVLNTYRFSQGTEQVRFFTALKYLQERYLGPVIENRLYTTPTTRRILGVGEFDSY